MTVKKNLKNIYKKEIIDLLYKAYKEKKKEVYKRTAEILDTAKRREVSVNLSKLDSLKNINDGSIVIVAGKVLGVGFTNKKIVVYAYSFSKTAKEKLKSNAKSLIDLTKDNIDVKKTVIVK